MLSPRDSVRSSTRPSLGTHAAYSRAHTAVRIGSRPPQTPTFESSPCACSETFRVPHVLIQMVEKKLLGDKTGGGFSKKTPDGILTLDLKTLEYRPQAKAKFPSIGAVKGIADVRERVATFLTQPDDRAVSIAKQVTYATLAYASNRVGEIADDLVNLDRGMRWGFGWELGPFETWDALGFKKTLVRMQKDGIAIPARIERWPQRAREASTKRRRRARPKK